MHWTMQDVFIVRRHTSKFEGKNPNYNPSRPLYKWPLKLCFVNLTCFELSFSRCMSHLVGVHSQKTNLKESKVAIATPIF
jgi:hypothetical protein